MIYKLTPLLSAKLQNKFVKSISDLFMLLFMLSFQVPQAETTYNHICRILTCLFTDISKEFTAIIVIPFAIRWVCLHTVFSFTIIVGLTCNTTTVNGSVCSGAPLSKCFEERGGARTFDSGKICKITCKVYKNCHFYAEIVKFRLNFCNYF